MPDSLTRPLPLRLLLTTDTVGGVWRYSLDLAQGMAERPTLAVLGPAPSASQRAEAAALGLRLIETGLPLDWTAESAAALEVTTAALQTLAEREGVSSVHLHAPALAGTGRWAVPVVVVAHSCVATWWSAVRGGRLPDDFAWRMKATEAGLRTANAVIAPTGAHREAVRSVYGDVTVNVVYNGARRIPLPPGEGAVPAILTAGRLWDEGKNAIALDRVAASLGIPVRAAGPVSGPNGARVELSNLRQLGTLGPEEMQRAYAEATVFASLARYEPFGLSVLEAAQAGLRLVLSDIPSFRELWDGAARFVPVDADPTPALRAALADHGDGGSAERAQRYTLAKMVEATLAVHRRAGIRV